MSSNPKDSVKPFASTADVEEKVATLEELADGVIAYTAEGDPNVGAIVGPEYVIAIDARATPTLARRWLDDLREHTDKPVRFLVLTHYHAVRVLGAQAFDADNIVAHANTRRWVLERGAQDMESEMRRFPRLFADASSVPGLTYPDLSFDGTLSFHFGDREVQLRYFGRAHTAGDVGIWLPRERILFAGDIVEAQATPYTGDAFVDEWRTTTLDNVSALGAEALVPGRGPTAVGEGAVREAVEETRGFLTAMRESVAEAKGGGASLKEVFDATRAALLPRYGEWPIFEHCLPFNVKRMSDELEGLEPQVWTARLDAEVWDELQR
jgi:glyoxylase-like metal-dependent hydrolase (beta-lactamase superfamily II)